METIIFSSSDWYRTGYTSQRRLRKPTRPGQLRAPARQNRIPQGETLELGFTLVHSHSSMRNGQTSRRGGKGPKCNNHQRQLTELNKSNYIKASNNTQYTENTKYHNEKCHNCWAGKATEHTERQLTERGATDKYNTRIQASTNHDRQDLDKQHNTQQPWQTANMVGGRRA